LTGFRKEIVKEGTGRQPKKGETVAVAYTGTFTNGKVFDSSVQKGKPPLRFQVGQGNVIRGWDEGVLTMKIGEKAKLTIDPDWAYGASGVGPIGPNETLIFDVELVDIVA